MLNTIKYSSFFAFCVTQILSAALNLSHSSNVIWSGDGTSSYDCFSENYYEMLVDENNKNFKVTYKSSDNTAYFLTFDKGASSTYNRIASSGSESLSYQLFQYASQTDVLKGIPDASSSDVIEGYADGSVTPREHGHAYYFGVYPQQIVSPGTYEDNIDIQLYEGSINGSYTLKKTKSVTMKVKVPAILKVLVGETGGGLSELSNYAVSFGALTEGATRNLEIQVMANQGYELLFKSTNRSQLQHSDYSQASPQEKEHFAINYLFNFAGTTYDLDVSGRVLVHTANTKTGLSGDTYNFDIEIASIDEKFSGDYSDTLELTARAI